MTKNKLVVIGFGAQGRMIERYVRDYKLYSWLGFVDDFRADECLGNVKSLESLKKKHQSLVAFVAIGHCGRRKQYFDYIKKLDLPIVSIVHPTAVIEKNTKLGKGIFVGARAVINNNANIGNGVYINTSSVVEHDNSIGHFSHLAPGVITGGNVKIGEGVFVGLGSRLSDGIILEDNIFVAVGAVVTKSFPKNVAIAGVPAKVHKIELQKRSRYQ